ncbi:C-terminal binding protein [uncultured Flavonifractor sp.]|uniref:C-terminal binding protein n=1 Tax=uncultured Flavonifractor sp. TaxID=1193534 RepID=UPI00261894D9|nr:C-terminal binding protein [uncultured Flavonifractor sp.]
MKVVLVDNKPVYSMDISIQQRVCDAYGMEYVPLNCASEEEVIAACKDADAILDIYTKMTPKIIDSLEKCKVMVRFGIGYDVIDVDACTKKGIFVCNVPDYCIEEVATHTVAMILDVCRKVTFYNDEVRKGKWVAASGYPMHRLSKQTVGFVGFGNIARRAAGYMAAFGGKIVAYDPFLPNEVFEQNHAVKVELDELLERSDIISLHTPLFDSTYHIINKDTIARMKDGVMIVNTSRGPLICEEDLLDGIHSGKIAAAGLDVVEFEPLTQPNYRLFDSGRVVVSPHAAFSTVDSNAELLEKVAVTACQILKKDFNDTLVRRIVNRKELSAQIG